jgi:hypothetical protein
MTTAERHQKNIAYKTLSMTPAGARIMGGMNYEAAYQLIFRTDLKERLSDLVKQYGTGELYSWELEKYGWKSPNELLQSL